MPGLNSKGQDGSEITYNNTSPVNLMQRTLFFHNDSCFLEAAVLPSESRLQNGIGSQDDIAFHHAFDALVAALPMENHNLCMPIVSVSVERGAVRTLPNLESFGVRFDFVPPLHYCDSRSTSNDR